MRLDSINISPDFFQVLREAKISSSTYKIALYLPELIQGGMVNFGQITGMSQTTFRRAVKDLEGLSIIAPTEHKSHWYFCNPHLIWRDIDDKYRLQLDRRGWDIMIKQRLQGQE